MVNPDRAMFAVNAREMLRLVKCCVPLPKISPAIADAQVRF